MVTTSPSPSQATASRATIIAMIAAAVITAGATVFASFQGGKEGVAPILSIINHVDGGGDGGDGGEGGEGLQGVPGPIGPTGEAGSRGGHGQDGDPGQDGASGGSETPPDDPGSTGGATSGLGSPTTGSATTGTSGAGSSTGDNATTGSTGTTTGTGGTTGASTGSGTTDTTSSTSGTTSGSGSASPGPTATTTPSMVSISLPGSDSLERKGDNGYVSICPKGKACADLSSEANFQRGRLVARDIRAEQLRDGDAGLLFSAKDASNYVMFVSVPGPSSSFRLLSVVNGLSCILWEQRTPEGWDVTGNHRLEIAYDEDQVTEISTYVVNSGKRPTYGPIRLRGNDRGCALPNGSRVGVRTSTSATSNEDTRLFIDGLEFLSNG